MAGPSPPEFRKPPVVEVALAVGFQPLTGFRSVEIGHLWDLYKAEFPNATDQAPIEMPIEQFGKTPGPPQIAFELMAIPPTPRIWFANESDTDLIQLQANWFARNWRKKPEASRYPKYLALRTRFAKDFRVFLDYVASRGLGAFRPTQCELTYINHIPVEGTVRGASDVLRLLSSGRTQRLPAAEHLKVGASYVLRHPPRSRLHLTVEPATRRSDDRPIIVLTLTARGAPERPDLQGILSFMDAANVEVVLAFDSLTTESMHKVWDKVRRREDA